LFFALGLCCLFEWWGTGYQGPEDITTHLGLPVLGHIPLLAASLEGGLPALCLEDPAHFQPTELEAFRTLRTGLMLCASPPKAVTLTSCDPDDGKTLIASNLAVAFAQSGLRTLIIDGDLRRSCLHQVFRVSRTLGLSQLLQQSTLTEEDVTRAIQRTSVPNLDILTSGPNPANPGELLMGNNLGRVLFWAAPLYDRIVCDAPPILAVSDCAILSRLMDGVLMVVRADKSDRARVARAHDVLRGMNCQVLGVIVNKVHSSSGYGAAYYGYSEYDPAYVRPFENCPESDGLSGTEVAKDGKIPPLPAA
jgi:capsular exopolysaccharide synthesis family protein